MKPEKRGRGRPKGSSRYNAQDRHTLESVADMLVRDSSLKATTAMDCLDKSDEASLRRLQRKWVKLKSELLDKAREDYRQERAYELQRRSENALAQSVKQMTATQRAFEGVFDTSAIRAITAEAERMRRLFYGTSPALEAMSHMQKQSEQLARLLAPTIPAFEAQTRAAQLMVSAFGAADIDSILVRTALEHDSFCLNHLRVSKRVMI